MSFTATHSMSASAASPARKTLRPMRPNPLIPTRTGMVSFLLRWRERVSNASRPNASTNVSVAAGHELDPQPIGVEEVGRVVARPVLVAGAGRAIVGAAGSQRGLVRGVHRRAAVSRDRDVAEARAGRAAAGDDPQPG